MEKICKVFVYVCVNTNVYEKLLFDIILAKYNIKIWKIRKIDR